ncbi:hypothetical protein CES86_5644 [Brucella lupini]|uniref:Uncharacterized protein n=1 Tax=Brucella lupini TaxID=255457 RepID=A0A256H1A0_9HYPH|nr:hypothetical protein CES86_5644 [Brucella lupini]
MIDRQIARQKTVILPQFARRQTGCRHGAPNGEPCPNGIGTVLPG